MFWPAKIYSFVPRPHPSAREKGLVTIARFLVCAESAVLNSRKPIRLQVLDLSCDKHAIVWHAVCNNNVSHHTPG